jgi:hypothetical protein
VTLHFSVSEPLLPSIPLETSSSSLSLCSSQDPFTLNCHLSFEARSSYLQLHPLVLRNTATPLESNSRTPTGKTLTEDHAPFFIAYRTTRISRFREREKYSTSIFHAQYKPKRTSSVPQHQQATRRPVQSVAQTSAHRAHRRGHDLTAPESTWRRK